MPLHCNNLPKEIVSKLVHEIQTLPITHPLHKEILDGDLTVYEQNGYAVYHSAGGFYFHRILTTLEETIRKDIWQQREYLCTVFEILYPLEENIQKLIDNFQAIYGAKYVKMIDRHLTEYNGKHLLLVKLPSCVVRRMLASGGGTMRTGVTGPTKSLKQIPTLVQLGQIDETKERATSMFVTQYGKDSFRDVTTIHQTLLREVCERPNLALTIHPYMIWDP